MADTDLYGKVFRDLMGIKAEGSDPIGDDVRGHSDALTAEAWVYRCVDINRKAIEDVELQVVVPATNGQGFVSIPHDALLLFEEANPFDYICGSELHGITSATQDLHGETYWQLNVSGGKPKEIYYRSNLTMEPKMNDGSDKSMQGPYMGFKHATGVGTNEILPLENVAFFKNSDPSNPTRGISPISAARDNINSNIYAKISNMSLHKNGSRPDYMLTTDQPLDKDQQGLLQKMISGWLKGPSKRGTPLVLGSNMKANLLSMSLRDSEWVNSMNLGQEAICGILGVPLMLAGNNVKSTLNNMEQAQAIFYYFNRIPYMKRYQSWLTRNFLRKLDPAHRDLQFRFNIDAITGLGEDIAQKTGRIKALVEARVLTPDMALEILGIQATVPGGKTFHVKLNDIPIEEAGVQANVDVAAAHGAPSLEAPTLGLDPASEDDGPKPPAPGGDKTPPGGKIPPTEPTSPTKSTESTNPKKKIAKNLKAKAASPDPNLIRERRLAAPQKKAVAKLKKEFQRQQVEALRNVRAKNKDFVLLTKDDSAIVPDNLWNRDDAKSNIGDINSELHDASFAEALNTVVQDYGINISFDLSNPKLLDIKSQLAQLVKGIDDTTMSDIQTLVTSAMAGGETFQGALTQSISDAMGGAIESRSLLIARTESMQAYGLSSLAYYQEAGAQALAYDGDDDPACADRNGQTVDLDTAEAWLGEEHPNGTLVFSPVVDMGDNSDNSDNSEGE